jgi:hypothetical protein
VIANSSLKSFDDLECPGFEWKRWNPFWGDGKSGRSNREVRNEGSALLLPSGDTDWRSRTMGARK